MDYLTKLNIAPYKIYTALLNQSSTNDPVPSVLLNTLGPIVWDRVAAGNYTGTLNGAFPTELKVWIIIKETAPSNKISCYWSDANTLQLDTVTDPNFNNSDDILWNIPIEIRVYP